MGIDSGNCASACYVIPSVTASPARTEGFRGASLKVALRDPSTYARDDQVGTRFANSGSAALLRQLLECGSRAAAF